MIDLFSFGDSGWGDELLAGLGLTLALALTTLPIGLGIGTAFAVLSPSRFRALRWIAAGYTTIMRGLPEILVIFLVYNGVGLLLEQAKQAGLPGSQHITLSPFVAGVTALAMVFGAFAAEVIRGAIQAVPRGQIEAAVSIGMARSLIFLRVTLPLAWRYALPGLGNLWLGLLKDTSLVSIIALNDLMRVSKVAAGVTKQPFTFYIAACLIYWLLCLVSEAGLRTVGQRTARGSERL
jgi:polar amino acid transport system permease protein